MAGKSFVTLLAFALFCVASLAAKAGPRGGGGPRIWSGLVMATNGPRPHAPAGEVHRFEGTLRRTFGYNNFEVIGQSRGALKNGEENWMARSKHFSLHVGSRGATRGGYRLKLRLYQDRQELISTEAAVTKSSPLVIRGPQVGSGQLLLLLEAQ
ncbi:MAG TPA: hypothetical protein VGG02_14755 [Chthoniobacterales bacterium]|jgi:hypothetical protein